MKASYRVGALAVIVAVCLFIAHSLHNRAAARPAGARGAVRIESTAGAAREGASAGAAGDAAKDATDAAIDDVAAVGALPGASATREAALLEGYCKNWLALESLSARYKLEISSQVPGRALPKYERTGTIELVVTQLGNMQEGHDYKVSVRMTDEQLGVTLAKDNIYDASQDAFSWTPDRPEPAAGVPQRPSPNVLNAMPIQELLEPLHTAREIYRNATIRGGGQLVEKQLLENADLVQRVSSAEETSKMFNGEQQLLVNLHSFPASYWFSREKGELRRIESDKPAPGVSICRSLQYEDYVSGPDSEVRFPTRFTQVIHYREGHPDAGSSETSVLELTDMKINQPIPAERFRLNNR